jgi:hypothetical protein
MALELDKRRVADIQEIATVVSKKKCILFLGAGAHYPPPKDLKHTCGGVPYAYPLSHRPPLGSKLSKDLARESNFLREFPTDNKRNLQRVALHYEIEKTRNSLISRIREAVDDGKTPSPVIRALAELDFTLIVTTNYDRLFERALYAAGKDPIVSTYNKDQEVETRDYPYDELKANRPFIFKIHGDIGQGESIVITDEDYIDFVMRISDKRHNPIPETFRYYLKKWPALFVGYSLMDYNLRLLFKTLRWFGDRANIPSTYSVDIKPDGLIYKVYSEKNGFVQFIVQDVWTFVPELYLRIKGKEMPL